MGSSTTTRNFGIRRFTNLVREARYRAPSGTALRLGTGVELDPNSTSDPQAVRQIAAGKGALNGGGLDHHKVGILWYEHDSQSYEGAAAGTLLQDYDTAPPGRMVQMLSGPGVKVWFRNTEASTTEPGLNFPNDRGEVIMVADLGHHGSKDLAVGDLLAWDAANNYWAKTSVPAEAILRVTHVDHDLGVCDAEMLV